MAAPMAGRRHRGRRHRQAVRWCRRRPAQGFGVEPGDHLGVDLSQNVGKGNITVARPENQHAGARTADDVANLGAAKAAVDVDANGTQPGAGQQQRQIGRCVGHPDGDPVAGRDAAFGQTGGHPAALLDELGEGNFPLTTDQSHGAVLSRRDSFEPGVEAVHGHGASIDRPDHARQPER